VIINRPTFHLNFKETNGLLPLSPIERPSCPKCKAQMALTRRTPGRAGFELQSFYCPKCEHVMTVEVADDPMKGRRGLAFQRTASA
jgi:ssDNA-binding Zn-finger/Zn-ribbon topoisomerase 1